MSPKQAAKQPTRRAVKEHGVTVRVGRARLDAMVRPGTGDGPPLLLCNGIGANHKILKPFMDQLDPRITAVRFDVPGVGASSMPVMPQPYSLIARTTAGMMKQLGYNKFDVLGISWGGGLAQQLAFQNPRRCRRVVLVATSTGSLMVPAHPRVLRHMITPGRYRDADYARSIAGTLYGGAVRDDPEIAMALHTRSRGLPSQRGYVYQLFAALGWSSLPALPLIRQRTLILAGTDDPLVPIGNAYIMAKLLPDAELHTYDDGHLALITRTAEMADLVSDFVLSS